MRASIHDKEALAAVSPSALSAYARAVGWVKGDSYGDHSDIYSSRELPEVILPRTTFLGDYTHIVSQLIEIFARVAETDELSLYRDLVTADRDVIRVRADAEEDGTVPLGTGVDLIQGAHDMLLAAACSLQNPRPLYRAGANRDASEYLRQVRLGQTEQGSFVVTLVTPAIPPPLQPQFDPDWGSNELDAPLDRRMTKRLAQALTATQAAAEQSVAGDVDAFSKAVPEGASANLCEALFKIIQPFPSLEVSTVWARTWPEKTSREIIRFARADAPILHEAARAFRSREPRWDEQLFGSVQRLKRDESEEDGTITLRASIGGRAESVTAILSPQDYELAIRAHQHRAPVIATGDLERVGQRWRLSSASIADVIFEEDAEDEGQ